MIKDKDPNGLIDDEDVQEIINFNDMLDSFYHNMKLLTKPKLEPSFLNYIKIFFIRAQKIDKSVFDFCSEKLEKIFIYAYENDLNDCIWSLFGFYMWRILYCPEKANNLPLSKEIIDYALNQFEGKQITVKKINGTYNIVFLK